MYIAIRKEPNGSIYMDKNIYSKTETLKFTSDAYQKFKEQNPNLDYTYAETKEPIEKQQTIFNDETGFPELKTTIKLVQYILVTKKAFTDEQLSQPPYNYTKVEIDDKYSDCIPSDFNDDLTFNVDKYNARKQKENQVDYENLIVSEIRKKYNINQELAILRQRDTKPEEYAEYNEYVENCKANVKAKMLLDK